MAAMWDAHIAEVDVVGSVSGVGADPIQRRPWGGHGCRAVAPHQ